MSFLIITWRRLLKERLYAAVCVLSLALGIAGSILISIYLYSELTFDHYHENHERIYRVTSEFVGTELAMTGFEIGPLVVNDNPQYLDYVRFRGSEEDRYDYGETFNEWDDVYFVDPSVFDVFTIETISGDPLTALSEPNSMAVSQSFAEFYFGDRNPIGEILTTERYQFEITLVFADLPENVSLRFEALLPFESFFNYRPDAREDNGDRYLSNTSTYFLVADEFDPASITPISENLSTSIIAPAIGSQAPSLGEIILRHHLQNLGDMHFSPAILGDDSSGNIVNLYIFAAVVVALLFSSCINYVNLATARAANRTREVATRKLLGAEGRRLIGQFIAESILFVGLGFAFALLLAGIVMQLGVMEAVTGKRELGALLLTPERIPVIILAWLCIGVLTGIYPAIKLSQPSMLAVMSPQASSGKRGLPLREILVWLQMTVAMGIIASVFIMLRQSDYLLETPLGFEKRNRLVVQLQGADQIRNRAAVMREIAQHPEVTNVTETTGVIGRNLSVSVQRVEQDNGEEVTFTYNSFNGGEDYLQTMGIEVIQGDSARLYQGTDGFSPILVNETLVQEMEWAEPIGMKIVSREVVGIVRDFHYRPLHDPIGSLVLSPFNDGFLDNLPPTRLDTITIDLIIAYTGNNEAGVRAHIIDTVDRFSDQAIIDVQSLESIWNEIYDDEARVIRLVGVFAALSVVISLLGLGGMAAYNNERRSKEVAIRKVLGASDGSILALLSKGMAIVLLLAAIPAFAAAWYLSNVWLQRFAYRIEANAAPFILALVIVGLCSAAVMLAQTWRTTRANPVERIKYE